MNLLSFAKKTFPLIIGLVIWEILSLNDSDFTFRFSNPSAIAESFYKLLFEKNLIEKYDIYYSFFLTFSEILVGFIIGNLIGTLLGLILFYIDEYAEISKYYLVALGSIPIFALAPLLILWFGTGFFAKIMMVTFSTFLISTIQAYEGAKNVDEEYYFLFRSYKATRLQIMKKLIIPSSTIWVLNSYKLNIGFAIIGAFIGEWISSQYGIGHLILAASGLYDVSMIFVGLICLMIMSQMLNVLIGFIEKKVLIWKYLSN